MRWIDSRHAGRRGVALIVAVLIISVTNLVVIGAVRASGDDARVAALRADTLRAFYASESGVRMGVREYIDDPANPLTGTVTLPGGEVVEVIDPLEASPAAPGQLVIEGSYGTARRRLQVDVQ